jgi:hypothetical protein
MCDPTIVAIRTAHGDLRSSNVVDEMGIYLEAGMSNYRRLRVCGGVYFFTVNLLQRGDNDLLVRHIDLLRASVRLVKKRHPFEIHAWVVLPDHLHCIIELPAGDDNLTWYHTDDTKLRNDNPIRGSEDKNGPLG